MYPTAFLALVLLGVFLLVGTLERHWDLQAKGIDAMPAAHAIFPLQRPLDCDATVTTKRHDHERGKTRCYSFKGEQK